MDSIHNYLIMYYCYIDNCSSKTNFDTLETFTKDFRKRLNFLNRGGIFLEKCG